MALKTYGTIERDGSFWRIKAERHVMIRIKRLFDRAAKHSVGEIKIRSTDEVCTDLLWILARYPLEVSLENHNLLRGRREEYVSQIQAVDDLLSGRIAPRAFDMALPPREYQKIAADMLFRTKGYLLGDDVGLGKTISAIATLTDPEARPALVVTLTHLTTQWERELHRFIPGITTHIAKKGKAYLIREMPDVILMNYHKLRGWSGALAGKVRSIVFDEIQELRCGDRSQKYEAAETIASECAYRLGLSATPVYNYGGEFYNVLSILRPGALGTKEEFLREWCQSSYGQDTNKARIREPEAFGEYVRDSGLMLRRTRRDVNRELPEVMTISQHIDTDSKPLEDVSDTVAKLAEIILNQTSAFVDRGSATRELDWRLRQATGISKAQAVAAFVHLLAESEEKIVLFAWHREVHRILMDLLKDLRPVLFSGSETVKKKDEARDRFVKGDARVLLMSLRSGAGIDGLQDVCRTVVFGELDWSPGVHEQCIGRIHRDGQRDPVAAYYLLSDSGSDPVVADVLGLKRQQIEGLIDPYGSRIEVSRGKDDAIKRLAEAYLGKTVSV